MHNALTYGLIIIALFVYLFACKILINDARQNYSLTMGAEMYFSNLWLVASILITAGVIRLFALKLWPAVPAVIVLYILSFPFRRVLKFLFLGRGLEKQDSGSTDNPD